MFISAKSQRHLIWISVALSLIFSLGYVMTGFFPPPKPTLGAAEVAELYASDNLRLRIGVVLCLLSGGFLMVWGVVVSAQMARVEKGLPVWAILQVLSAAMGALIFTLPLLFVGVAAFSAERSAEITLLMHELAFLTLITPVTFFPFQALPVGVIALSRNNAGAKNSPFPRWLGFLTLWMLACAELGTIAMLFKTGPFAWNGLFAFWLPLSIYAIWYTALTRQMLKAIARQEADGTA